MLETGTPTLHEATGRAAQARPAALLEIENLDVSYGGMRALRGLSLHVGAGEAVCLIGANGGGKSTALKALLGLVQPASGTIRFDGETLNGKATEDIVALGIGVVPEGRRVFPGLTVRENLRVGSVLDRRRRGEKTAPRDRFEEGLAEVYALFPRLAERRNQMGLSMSGGEQQMLAIGRALMGRPRLLVLDEPSLGLAPLAARDVFKTIGDIARRGMAVLIAEQNAELALAASQRAYVLENGRLVLEGGAGELAGHADVRAAFLGTPSVGARNHSGREH